MLPIQTATDPRPTMRGAIPAVLAGLCAALTLAGLGAYLVQLTDGLGVTGLGQPVFWGVYIVNFVFFIGIAHAGTLVSAVLRLVGADWCKPITRLAEVMTVIFLAVGALQIFIDLGRPDRAPWFFLRDGRFQSPLLWDATCIIAYFTASLLYLYIPLVPDLGGLRDRGVRPRFLYAVLALNWRGTARQWQLLHRAMTIMAVLIVPIAVSVHSVISFIFATTLQPGWHSTIFAPYFVVGAIFSGIAAILLTMIAVRRVLGLGAVITETQIRKLGRLLLVFCLVWCYFTLAETLPVAYGGVAHDRHLIGLKIAGPYAGAFWAMVLLNLAIPLACLVSLRNHPVPKVVLASLAVLAGMWIERYLILVPTLQSPRLPLASVAYGPTWVEMAITAGSVGLFGLAFLGFARLFPLIPAWEVAGPAAPTPPAVPASPTVRIGQIALGAGILALFGAVLAWMGRLVLVAFALDDAPWLAAGVTLAVLPVFLILMGVVLTVFRGLLAATAPGEGD